MSTIFKFIRTPFGKRSHELIYGTNAKKGLLHFIEIQKNIIKEEHNFYDSLMLIRNSIISLAERPELQHSPDVKNYLFDISAEIYKIYILLERLDLRTAKFEKKEEKWIMKYEYTKLIRGTKHFTNVEKRKLNRLKSEFRKVRDLVSNENERKLEELIAKSLLNLDIFTKIRGILQSHFNNLKKCIIIYDDAITNMFNEELSIFERLRSLLR